MKSENIASVLNSLTDIIGKENVELYKKLIDQSPVKNIENVDDFHMGIIYPFNCFLDGLIAHEISTNKGVDFLLIHSGYVEQHFEKLIVRYEGSACCSDKTRTVLNSIFLWLTAEQKIEFN